MNIQLDLLKDAERRRIGIADPRAVMRIAAMAVLALIVAVAVIIISTGISRRSEFNRLDAAWANGKKEFTNLKNTEAELKKANGLVAELNVWSEARIDWFAPLMNLADLVPPSIQLKSLKIKSSVYFKEKKEAEEVAPSLMRRTRCTLDGTTKGEMGDEEVVLFLDDIRDSEEMGSLLTSVKLDRLQREASGDKNTAVRAFTVEAVFAERILR